MFNNQQWMTEKRKFVRELEAQLTDAHASLLRTEAEASRLATETTNTATEVEVERDGAVVSAGAKKKRRLAAEAAAARYDDRALSCGVPRAEGRACSSSRRCSSQGEAARRTAVVSCSRRCRV